MSLPVPIKLQQGVTTAIMQPMSLPSVEGWQFAAQIRPSAASPEVLVEWLPEQVEAHPYAILLPIDPELSATWTWSRGVLGLEARSPEGQVTRILQTPIMLDREVVRPFPFEERTR